MEDYPTTTWSSNYNFLINDADVKEDVDYHTLSWDHRSLDLDTIIGPKNQVVTGVRFRIVDHHIRFEIRTTPFDFTTGELDKSQSSSTWRGNNYHNKRNILITEADVPTRSSRQSHRDRRDDKYIDFTPTDIKKDIAQSTGEY